MSESARSLYDGVLDGQAAIRAHVDQIQAEVWACRLAIGFLALCVISLSGAVIMAHRKS